MAWSFIRQQTGAPSENPVPGYTLVNARVNYDLPFRMGAAGRPMRVSIFGQNLLNKRPEETILGSVNRLTGRQVFAQLEVHF